jgi:hypothetical protein
VTILSYLFFLIAPVSVFLGAPLPVALVFVVLAVIGLGKVRARKAQVTMSVRDWAIAVLAELRKHPVSYAVQLVSLWLIPVGLTTAGFIPGTIALLGGVASYLMLGRLSATAAGSITGTQVSMLLSVITWLGMTEEAFLEAGCQVARGTDGSIVVSPVPNAALLLGAERIEDRMLALQTEFELVTVTRARIVFAPLTLETMEAREQHERTGGMLSAPAGATNTIPVFPTANVTPAAPALDFSGGFTRAPVAGAGLVSEGL